MLMEYIRFNMPLSSANIRECSVEELKALEDWYLLSLDDRVQQLRRLVATLDPKWQPDLSLSSLDTVDQWFRSNARSRRRTSEELAEIRASLRFSVDVSDYELTDQTLSFSADVGIYMALVLKHLRQDLSWGQELKRRDSADFGYPVLMGFGGPVFNPLRIGGVAAQKIINGKAQPLADLVNIWAGMRPK